MDITQVIAILVTLRSPLFQPSLRHTFLSASLKLPSSLINTYPDSKVHGANMGPNRGRQDPGGPHIGPMNFAIWVLFKTIIVRSWKTSLILETTLCLLVTF